jgi:hypothetical protein
MVQTQMGLKPYIEYVDAVPEASKQRKQIFENGEWKERIFIRIPTRGLEIINGTKDNGYRSCTVLEKWCRDHYKAPKYQGPWFKIDGYIILDDRTYVHWKLCE